MQGQPAIDNLQSFRLLIRGVNWLGDAVMTTPALARLRQAFPRAQLTMLSPRKLGDLWTAHPALDSVLTFESGQSAWTVARSLRPHKFDAALILPNSPRSALECYLARIPRRVGYRASWRHAFLTQAIDRPSGQPRQQRRSAGEVRRMAEQPRSDPPFEHQIHDYLRLAAVLGADSLPLEPQLRVNPTEINSVRDILNQQFAHTNGGGQAQPGAWLAISVSAAYGPAKCWPLERFAEVVRQVSRANPSVAWVHLGTAADWQAGEHLAAAAPGRVLNLAGKTSLRQLMSVLKVCRLSLCNDSGPMHVAAALGTPVVVPFGSTSPELTGPGGLPESSHQILRGQAGCAPCFRRTCPLDFRCMHSIAVEHVQAAVLQVLAGGSALK